MAISRKGRLTCVHDHPKYSPVAARHREIPRERNGNNRTRLQKNTRQNTCPRRICVPTVETVRHIHAPARSPAVAHRREIPRIRNENNRTRLQKKHPPKHLPAQDLRPYGRNGTPHTRASPLARGGSPPSGSATLTETTRAVRFTFYRKYVIIRKTQRQKRKTKGAE